MHQEVRWRHIGSLGRRRHRWQSSRRGENQVQQEGRLEGRHLRLELPWGVEMELARGMELPDRLQGAARGARGVELRNECSKCDQLNKDSCEFENPSYLVQLLLLFRATAKNSIN